MGLYTNMGGVGKTCFISRVAKLKSEKILENPIVVKKKENSWNSRKF